MAVLDRNRWPLSVRIGGRFHRNAHDSLSVDLAAAGEQNQAIQDRILGLGMYARNAGADAVLYTCSAFCTSIDRAKSRIGVPTFKPDEAMINMALDTGGRIGLLAIFEPAVAGSHQQFLERVAERGLPLDIELLHVPDAMVALRNGDGDGHDRLIAEAAKRLPGCSCVALAQFSMARARVEAATGLPVLTSPMAAVSQLRKLFSVPTTEIRNHP